MGRIDGIFDVFWYAKMPAPQGAGIFCVWRWESSFAPGGDPPARAPACLGCMEKSAKILFSRIDNFLIIFYNATILAD